MTSLLKFLRQLLNHVLLNFTVSVRHLFTDDSFLGRHVSINKTVGQ